MLKNGFLLVSTGTAGKILNLIRTSLLARLLTVEDYGIIATFALTVSMLQMLSAMAFDRLLVQDSRGDEPIFAATIQTMKLARGILFASVLFVFAGPLARLMGVDNLVWPYQVLALLPLLQAISHVDQARQQRHSNFSSFMTMNFVSEAVALLVALVLALVLNDWRIGLYATIAAQIAATLVTFLMATRPFELGLDRDVAKRAMQFGWPLLVNAGLLFAIFNGDRIIVSNQFGLQTLAGFSLMTGLAMVPTAILFKTHQLICLPQLSRHQDSPSAFSRAAVLTVQTSVALGIMMMLGFSLVGPDAAILLFGSKYEGLGTLLILLGLYQALRLFRSGSSVIAMSKGETQNPYRANLVRLLGLPLALWVAMSGGSLIDLVLIALVFESLALLASLLLLKLLLDKLPMAIWVATATGLAILVLTMLDIWIFPPEPGLFGNAQPTRLIVAAAGIAALLSLGETRRWLMEKLRTARLR